MTELQILAQKKYNKIVMGNGSDLRNLKLFNVRAILDKANLTEDDVLLLQQFVDASREQIDKTAYVANAAVYPTSWNHKTVRLTVKTTKNNEF